MDPERQFKQEDIYKNEVALFLRSAAGQWFAGEIQKELNPLLLKQAEFAQDVANPWAIQDPAEQKAIITMKIELAALTRLLKRMDPNCYAFDTKYNKYLEKINSEY